MHFVQSDKCLQLVSPKMTNQTTGWLQSLDFDAWRLAAQNHVSGLAWKTTFSPVDWNYFNKPKSYKNYANCKVALVIFSLYILRNFDTK